MLPLDVHISYLHLIFSSGIIFKNSNICQGLYLYTNIFSVSVFFFFGRDSIFLVVMFKFFVQIRFKKKVRMS